MSVQAARAALDFLLAPLQPVLAAAEVTEILVNGPDAGWYERDGALHALADLPTPEQLLAVARLVSTLSRVDTLDRHACLEGRWNSWRVTMVLPPVSGDHPCLALRRHRAAALPLGAWSGVQPPALAGIDAPSAADRAGRADCGSPVQQLRAALRRRDNILVAGATGSGKTTLLASLLGELGTSERLVCLEDTPELPWLGPHQLRLYARQGHDLRSLLRLALRLRPDRIVIGEVRGGEAFDLLQAMATGHRGCLATLHAADAAGALRRLEQLVLTAGLALPLEAARRQVSDHLQLVVIARRTGQGRAIGEVFRLAAAD